MFPCALTILSSDTFAITLVQLNRVESDESRIYVNSIVRSTEAERRQRVVIDARILATLVRSSEGVRVFNPYWDKRRKEIFTRAGRKRANERADTEKRLEEERRGGRESLHTLSTSVLQVAINASRMDGIVTPR